MITKDEKGMIVIHSNLFHDGESLVNLQKSLSLAIEHLGEHNEGDADYKMAIFMLSELLRSSLLTDSQTNVGLGGSPYRNDTQTDDSLILNASR